MTKKLFATRRFVLKSLAIAGVTGVFCSSAFDVEPAQKSGQAGAAPRKPVVAKTKEKERQAAVTPQQLRGIIQEKLAKSPYYSPGFLISHRDVEPIFNFLLEKGVTIAEDHEELYDSILPDNSQLVRLLRTPKGREFQKKLAGDAAAYNRLERLSWHGDGRKVIEGYLDSKDGLAKFQTLKTAADVGKLSKSLAADSRTADFALPTGRIHTADELLKSLEQALAKQKPAAE